MVSIIVSGHGQFSLGLLDAFEMIFGKDVNVQAVPFFKGEGLPQMQEKFQQKINQIGKDKEVLILVDIFAGTPYNAAAQIAYTNENIDILTGVNLPILLEAAAVKEQLTLAQLIENLRKVATDSHQNFRSVLTKRQDEVDEEEDLL